MNLWQDRLMPDESSRTLNAAQSQNKHLSNEVATPLFNSLFVQSMHGMTLAKAAKKWGKRKPGTFPGLPSRLLNESFLLGPKPSGILDQCWMAKRFTLTPRSSLSMTLYVPLLRPAKLSTVLP